jgi:hypothetical protein
VKTCWQIRQELVAAANGAARLTGWKLACSDCTVPFEGRSCWEQCAGSPCCCAPIHITCDFCEIYLEHRRELAGLPQHEAAQLAASANLKPELQPEGGTPIMEKVQFNVPNLWADHHTLKVREARAGAERPPRSGVGPYRLPGREDRSARREALVRPDGDRSYHPNGKAEDCSEHRPGSDLRS